MRLRCADWGARLAGYDPATLAAWYSTLNGFVWPEDFPVPKPLGYDAAPHRCRAGTVVDRFSLQRSVMQALRHLTTSEERSRAWWRQMGRTDVDWQDWWDHEGQGGGPCTPSLS